MWPLSGEEVPEAATFEAFRAGAEAGAIQAATRSVGDAGYVSDGDPLAYRGARRAVPCAWVARFTACGWETTFGAPGGKPKDDPDAVWLQCGVWIQAEGLEGCACGEAGATIPGGATGEQIEGLAREVGSAAVDLAVERLESMPGFGRLSAQGERAELGSAVPEPSGSGRPGGRPKAL